MKRALALLLLTASPAGAGEWNLAPLPTAPALRLFWQAVGTVGLYREDGAHVSGQLGSLVLAVRKDASGSLCGTDGDFCPFQVDATGQVRVVATSAQLPAALDGSGFLKVHEQGTATISGTVTANAGSNLNTSALALDATITGRLPAGSTPGNGESNAVTTSRLGSFNFVYNGATWDRWTGAVTGTVTANQGGTWTVQPGSTANTTPWLVELSQTGAKNDVDVLTLPANASVNLAQVGATNVSTGAGAGGAGIPRVTVSNDSTVGLVAGTARIGSVRPVDSADADLTSAKATQTSRAVGTQDLKDAGRTAVSFYANAVASGTTGTETLITLTQSKGTGATSSVTTYTITSGKTLRITGIAVASRGNATATAQTTIFNLRLNTGGACLVSSTPILMGIGTATPATASAWDRAPNPFSSDGYEIAGNGTIALCISANAVFVTNAPTWYVNVIGYEY